MIENLLRYEPATGKLIWLVDRPNGVKAGQEAGSVRKDGYRYVCVEDQRYFLGVSQAVVSAIKHERIHKDLI